MALYELCIIVKNMPKASTVSAVKRIADSILDEGGYVSKFESLGTQELPFKLSIHGQIHTKGNYFLINFVAPPTAVSEILDTCRREIDVFRPGVTKIEPQQHSQCTLHEEIQFPSFRPEVLKMIQEAKSRLPKHLKKKGELKKTVIGYNPF
ncbi:hypothetical protein OTU49_013944 [Cherax quadricarinatus]|uniref:Small ribosomal subunit protein bS6m n=1 Tax=Cherax quadricarinatus TaxID=27406 RepID=A0AAW0VRW9_CHEQU|nr:28S ribosomal protein S6, mitochondrial-like [Cherax quadricarinatus]